ncbi:hypothetical protein [Photorhabdus cinerea]|nr:hypothetical protein [Photorhabdus cinerea]
MPALTSLHLYRQRTPHLLLSMVRHWFSPVLATLTRLRWRRMS